MKKTLLFLSLVFLASAGHSQTPSTSTVKKAVKIGAKFYIETTTTSKFYTEINTSLLLDTEHDEDEAKRDDEEVERKQAERVARKSDRIERSKLLKEAYKQGFKPEAQTLEEQEKIKSIKAKLDKIK